MKDEIFKLMVNVGFDDVANTVESGYAIFMIVYFLMHTEEHLDLALIGCGCNVRRLQVV